MEKYLILSLKWTRGQDLMVWYRPQACGYTTWIDKAGRYTEDEARAHVGEGVTIAVPESVAVANAAQVVVADQKAIDGFAAASLGAKGRR